MHKNERGEWVIGRSMVVVLDKNPAVDEHAWGAGADGVLGIFFGGWCIAGLRLSVRYQTYGVILLNHFIGLWSDPDL